MYEFSSFYIRKLSFFTFSIHAFERGRERGEREGQWKKRKKSCPQQLILEKNDMDPSNQDRRLVNVVNKFYICTSSILGIRLFKRCHIQICTVCVFWGI